MPAEPFSCVTVRLDVEVIAADPVDAGERSVELLPELLREAGAIALQTARSRVSSWLTPLRGGPAWASSASCASSKCLGVSTSSGSESAFIDDDGITRCSACEPPIVDQFTMSRSACRLFARCVVAAASQFLRAGGHRRQCPARQERGGDLADRAGGGQAHRRTVRYRARHPRPKCRTASASTPGAERAAAGGAGSIYRPVVQIMMCSRNFVGPAKGKFSPVRILCVARFV